MHHTGGANGWRRQPEADEDAGRRVERAGLGGVPEAARKDTAVYWPGQPDPTRGRDAHQAESEAFFKSIENSLENDPYKVMFASGDWTCTIAKWKGKMIGPWMAPDGKVVQATGKSFELAVLHRGALEGRRDCRGEPVLRSGRVPEGDRRHVAANERRETWRKASARYTGTVARVSHGRDRGATGPGVLHPHGAMSVGVAAGVRCPAAALDCRSTPPLPIRSPTLSGAARRAHRRSSGSTRRSRRSASRTRQRSRRGRRAALR